MNVLNWPGLEKRTEDFEQTASAEEIMMIYCQSGSARLSADGEEDATVKAGELVMLSDGAVRWSGLAEGGVTLLTTTTDVDGDGDEAATTPPGSDDLSVTEGAVLLAAGLVFGALISFGTKLLAAP